MSWRVLPVIPMELKGKTRFLVDEDLGPDVAKYLKAHGYNAAFVGDVGLLGHTDEDVFAFAWRERRVLLTLDRDYLDDQRFPEHRNPGLVILSGGSGDGRALSVSLGVALSIFSVAPAMWERTKCTVSADGYLTVRLREAATGAMNTRRYRTRGPLAEWEDNLG